MMNLEEAAEDSQPQDAKQEKDTDSHPSLQNEKRKKKKKKRKQTDGNPLILVLPLVHTYMYRFSLRLSREKLSIFITLFHIIIWIYHEWYKHCQTSDICDCQLN